MKNNANNPKSANNGMNNQRGEQVRKTLALVLCVVAFVAMAVSALLPSVEVRLGLMGAGVVLAGTALCVRYLRWGQQDFLPTFMRQLREAGYECKLTDEEQVVCIKVQDSALMAQVLDTAKKGQHRVHFSALMPVDRNEMSQEGMNYMATQMNAHNDYVTVRVNEEGFECRVETIVVKAKETAGELAFALGQIDKAARVMMRNYEHVVQKFPAKPAQQRHVGFLIHSVREREEAEQAQPENTAKWLPVDNSLPF